MPPTVFIWATVDEARGLALITGRGTDALVRDVAPDARWSRSGNGWVITVSQLSDLACLCDVEHVPYREKVA
jgi:hypothetical protein